MIIISQDKDLIVNFDNITVVGITQNNSKEIDSITVDKKEQYLAEYKTEERAKEVLQEIITMYQANKLFSDIKGVLNQEEMCKQMQEQGKDFYKFQMPEE